jgi:hypothetical protein
LIAETKLAPEELLKQLGGTIKIAKILSSFKNLAEFKTADWCQYLETQKLEGKFTFGFSVYHGNQKDYQHLFKLALSVKKELKAKTCSWVSIINTFGSNEKTGSNIDALEMFFTAHCSIHLEPSSCNTPLLRQEVRPAHSPACRANALLRLSFAGLGGWAGRPWSNRPVTTTLPTSEPGRAASP